MITRRVSTASVAVLAALASAGCASSPPRLPQHERPLVVRNLPRFETASPAGRDDPSGKPLVERGGKLFLADALALALTGNPELAVVSWEVRAREAEAMQASLRPNPEASLEVENFGGTGEVAGLGGAEATVSFSQLIELAGKRGKRFDFARTERDVAAWEYESRLMDVFADVTKAFVAALAAQRDVGLAEELVEVAEGVLETVQRQVAAGAVSPVEESRARVALDMSRVALDRSRRALTVERKRLAALWGSTDPQFTEAVGDLESIPPVPSADDLLGLTARSPELVRMEAELQSRSAELALEKALAVPDLTVGAGVRRMAGTDENAFVLELSIPVPFFDRNQGSVQAAESRLAQSESRRRAVEVRLRTEIAAAYEELAASQAEATALRDRVIPEAQTAFSTTRDAYRKGLMRFTDVLDTQRTLFELRGRYFRSLARLHSAVAEIERLIGKPLEDVARKEARQ